MCYLAADNLVVEACNSNFLEHFAAFCWLNDKDREGTLLTPHPHQGCQILSLANTKRNGIYISLSHGRATC
jgi:hypothetical protein